MEVDSFHSIWEVSRQYLLWNKMKHQPYYTLLIREYIANKFSRWRVGQHVRFINSQVYQSGLSTHDNSLWDIVKYSFMTVAEWLGGAAELFNVFWLADI